MARRIAEQSFKADGRPEPERVDASTVTGEEFTQLAVKAARFHLVQSRRGKRRAKLGYHWGGGTPEDLQRGRRNAPRCTAIKKDGTRCRQVVVRGSDRCARHEGVERAPWSAAAGRRYLAGKLKQPSGRYRTHPSVK